MRNLKKVIVPWKYSDLKWFITTIVWDETDSYPICHVNNV